MTKESETHQIAAIKSKLNALVCEGASLQLASWKAEGQLRRMQLGDDFHKHLHTASSQLVGVAQVILESVASDQISSDQIALLAKTLGPVLRVADYLQRVGSQIRPSLSTEDKRLSELLS